MECPRCTLPLKKVDLGAFRKGGSPVLADLCPDCQGGWFDKGELAVSDENAWTEAEGADPRSEPVGYSPLLCPRCYVPLSPVTSAASPGLILDRCPDCSGFWLDEGEMGAVQALAAQLDSAKMEEEAFLERPSGWSWFRRVFNRAGDR